MVKLSLFRAGGLVLSHVYTQLRLLSKESEEPEMLALIQGYVEHFLAKLHKSIIAFINANIIKL